MSLPDRRHVLTLLAALPLAAGCGFTPAYAPGGAGTRLRGKVRVQPPETRNDFDFVTRLESRLGPAQAPAYALSYSIATGRQSGGYSVARSITRYTLTGTLTYTLTDTATDQRVAGGTLRNFASWSATGSTIAGITAEEDAATRLMQMLADDLVTALLADLT